MVIVVIQPEQPYLSSSIWSRGSAQASFLVACASDSEASGSKGFSLKVLSFV